MSRKRQSDSLGAAYAPLALAIALGLTAVSSQAANIVVDTTDVTSSPDHCSITDAVTAINNQAIVGGCTAGTGTATSTTDTIDLTHFTSPTTITLISGTPMTGHALVLSKPANFLGALAGDNTPLVTLQRSAVTGSAVFGLISSNSPLGIYGLTLAHGDAGIYSGGAVQAGGPLVVHDSTITSNSAQAGGGIASSVSLEIKNSIVSENTAMNGGGIVASGGLDASTTTISNNKAIGTGTYSGGGGVFLTSTSRFDTVTLSGNTSASAGGAVYATNAVTLLNSTLTGNSANDGAGGAVMDMAGSVYSIMSTIDGNNASLSGGGIYAKKVSLTNSTLTGNGSAADGGAVQADTFVSAYSTIAQNTATGIGGGVKFTSTADAQGTIIYGNMPTNLETTASVPMTGQFNLVGLDMAGAGVPADTISCDPMLIGLADNGGLSKTMALPTGSCAIDAASASLPANITTDQRGYARPFGTGTSPKADIGAYEFGASDPDVIFKNGFDS